MNRFPLIVRYVIVIAFAFACNIYIASKLVSTNVKISSISQELQLLSRERSEMESVLAQRRSSDYITRRARELGFTQEVRPLYVLTSQVAKQ